MNQNAKPSDQQLADEVFSREYEASLLRDGFTPPPVVVELPPELPPEPKPLPVEIEPTIEIQILEELRTMNRALAYFQMVLMRFLTALAFLVIASMIIIIIREIALALGCR
jgi:hypothetical protein